MVRSPYIVGHRSDGCSHPEDRHAQRHDRRSAPCTRGTATKPRWLVAVLCIIYGFAKLNGSQFTVLDSELARPMGEVRGFWLVWYFFGSLTRVRVAARPGTDRGRPAAGMAADCAAGGADAGAGVRQHRPGRHRLRHRFLGDA
ncbi:MAG: hypothetical protein U5K74_07480 [Gemmatimonadaceae bacterium]|nr:hypothetical protein [Gemmatimonadaceae bacterium]